MGDMATLPAPRRVGIAYPSHRILLYTVCYNVLDGVTLTIRKIERELLAAGHHVCILTTNSGDGANTHLDGTHPNRQVLFLENSRPIFFLHDPNNASQTYHAGFTLSKNMRKRIDEFEPSLVHVTVPDPLGLWVVQYARQRQIPLMGTYHSNIPEYMDHYPGVTWVKHVMAALFRHQYNFMQRLYVPTPYIQDHLTESYQMDRVTNLDIWGRGIDLEQFAPSYRSFSFRHKLGIDDEDVVVCFVGRLVPEKRVDIFAEVVRRLHARNVPFHALVVGTGPCEGLVAGLPNTTLCGWLVGRDLAVAYASSDVFLFPSSVETFGNVTLEAAASGLPLVVEGKCSGHLVTAGENGYPCPTADVDAFFDATLQLVVDEEKRLAFSQASTQLSMRFEQRHVVQKMLNHYDEVTEEFYCDFGGQHENRDRQYRQQGSFRFGNHPLPIFILLTCAFMELLMVVGWRLTLFFYCIQGVLIRQLNDFASSQVQPQATAPDGNSNGSSSSVTSKDSTSNDTLETVASSASSDHSNPSRCTTASTPFVPAPRRLTDSECFHGVVKTCLAMVAAQSRAESFLRNCLAACFLQETWASRKRKDSNMCANAMVSLREDSDEYSLVASSREQRVNMALLDGAEVALRGRGRRSSPSSTV